MIKYAQDKVHSYVSAALMKRRGRKVVWPISQINIRDLTKYAQGYNKNTNKHTVKNMEHYFHYTEQIEQVLSEGFIMPNLEIAIISVAGPIYLISFTTMFLTFS